MTALSISKAWEETSDVLARDGRLIGAVALAAVLLPQAIAGVVAPPPNLSGEAPPSWMPVLTFLVALAGLVGQIAVMRLALGPATSVGEAITHGLRRVLPAFAAYLLFILPFALICAVLLVAIGGPSVAQTLMSESQPQPGIVAVLALFVIVTLAFYIRFLVMFAVATVEAGNPIQILRRSWELTRGNYWRLLGFCLLIGILLIVLVLSAQFIGGILAKALFGDAKPLSIAALIVVLITGIAQTAFTVIASTMTARIYAQLAGRAKSGT